MVQHAALPEHTDQKVSDFGVPGVHAGLVEALNFKM